AQLLQVDTLPTIVSGFSKDIASWIVTLALDKPRMASLYDQPQNNELQLKNPFSCKVTGSARINVPDQWLVEPKEVNFKLDGGEQWRQAFSLTFPYTVETGRHEIRIDFDIQADKHYKFSVLKHIEIDLSNAHVEIKTRLNKNNELEVRQCFVNESDRPVNFTCELYVPQRIVEKTLISNLNRGKDMQTYRLEKGDELIGQTLWLRAVDSSRPAVLNYHFTAKR
ncbi:MAG: hypothetical protein ACWGMZ_10840, partial [Thermoguttaceae bacterium]